MRNELKIILLFCASWLSCHASAQMTIEVSQNKTSHLVFPTDIMYVDLGDAAHFVADYTNSILRIKGTHSEREYEMPSTNLTVITKDRFYYSFLVHYVANPRLNYFIETQQSIQNIGLVKNKLPHSPKGPKTIPAKQQQSRSSEIPKTPSKKAAYQQLKAQQKEKDRQATIEQTAHQIIQDRALYHHITTRHGDIKLKVTGIYHSLEHCYIKYEIQNGGAIPYDIAYTEFGIKEKKRPKRTALNEERLSPIFVLNEDIKRVLPMRKNRFVAVFDKLAVPKDRILYMEVIEDGRNLRVLIPFGRIKIEQVK